MMTSMRMDQYRVFAPEFLDAISNRWDLRRTGPEASSAGPFRVIHRDKRFAVLNDPEPNDGLPVGEFTEDQWALLTAATYGAHYRERTLRLASDRDETGQFPVLERYFSGDSCKVAGWMPYSIDRHLESIHVAEYIPPKPASPRPLSPGRQWQRSEGRGEDPDAAIRPSESGTEA